MSKTIDEKVVEMKFNNRDFETNVKQTLNSLDKLKSSLKLPDSSKSIDNINKSLGKADVSNLLKGLESAKIQFSALEVIGVTALANITNSAVNAGKRIVSALTIEPITTGFNEYELKMESVRTIMASTGESVEVVNNYLNELNRYSDQTIYKFSDMTQNIGKFTNAGVKLEDAVIAMKGLSNEAAVSGANTQEAARAMYNFAQALSMGYVQLIDWKSIENANMATVEFKQNLLDTAVNLKTITKTNDGLYRSGKHTYNLQQMFKDGLKDQWLTTEVLLETLKDYGDETTEIGKKAYAAAQDVVKFTQMWDVLKETAQSGWAQTWELLFGDINQAKAIFTPLTKFVGGFINKMSDARNKLLQTTFATNFKSLFDNVKNTANSIRDVANAVKDYGQVVDEIINGKFGNGQARWDKLTESGYDWAHAQNLVNEKLGSSVRYATNFNQSQEEMIQAENKLKDSTNDFIIELSKLSDEELRNKGLTDIQINSLRSLQDAADKTGLELKYLLDNIDDIDGRFLLLNSFKNIGKSLIKVFSSIGIAWRDAFPPMSSDTLFNLIAGLHKFSVVISKFVDNNVENLTRTLKGLFAILDIIATFAGGGFKIAFTILQGILEGLGYSFGNVLELTAFLGDKLVFIRNIINDKIIKTVSFFTSKIKTLIITFRNWYNSTGLLNKGLSIIGDGFIKVTTYIKEFIKTNSVLQNVFNFIKDGFAKIGDSIRTINVSHVKDIGKNIIEGLLNGIGSGVKKVVDCIINIAKTILHTFAKILRIESPSKEFYSFGNFIIEGLIQGIANGNQKVLDTIKNIGNKIKEIFEKMNIGRFLSIMTDSLVLHIASPKLKAAYALAKTLLGGFGVFVHDIFNTIQGSSSNAEFITNSIDKIGNSLGNLFSNIRDWFNGIKNIDNPAQYIISGLANGLKHGFSTIIKVVSSLGKIIYETICKVLGIESPSKVFFAIGGFIVLGLVAGLKSGYINVIDAIKGLGAKLVETFKQVDFGKIFAVGLAVGLIFTVNNIMKTLKFLGSVVNGVMSPLKSFAKMLDTIGNGIATYYTDMGKAEKMKAMGSAIKDFAIAIAILAGSIYLLSKIEYSSDMWILFGYLSAIVGVMTLLAFAMTAINRIPTKNTVKMSTLIFELSISILALAAAMRMLGSMDSDNLSQALEAVSKLLIGLSIYMAAYSKFAKGKGAQNMDKAAKMLLGVSASLLIISFVLRSLAKLSPSDLAKSITAIGFVSLIFIALIAASKFAGKGIDKLGLSMIAMAFALKTMVGVVKTASKLNVKDVAKGIVSLAMIETLFVALIAVSKFAGKHAFKAGGMLLGMSFALFILVGVIKLISGIDDSEIDRGINIIKRIGSMFALLIAVSVFSGKNALKAGTMLLEASLSLLTLVGALYILGKMNPDELDKGLEIIERIGLMFASLIFVSKYAGKDSIKVITSLTVALGILIGGLIGLSFIDGDKLLSSVKALTIVMLAFSTMIGATSLLTNSGSGLGTIITLTVIVGALVGLVFLMGAFNSDNLMNNAKSMVLLSTALLEMSIVLGILTIVGTALPAAAAGLAGLTVLIGAFGLLIFTFDKLNANGKLEEIMNNTIPLLNKFAYGIGSFIGNIVKGFSEAVLSILPYFGTQLSLFMTNLTPFIEGAKKIDLRVLEGIGILSLAIAALLAAEFIEGIMKILHIGSGIDEIGTKLSNFAMHCLPFINIMSSGLINDKMLSGVKTLTEAILLLTVADFVDGLTSLFNLFKDDSGDKLGEKLANMGKGLTGFAEEVKGINNISQIKLAAEAAKVLVEMANMIPNEGGLMAWISGDNDMSKFAEKLKPFGEGLKQYGEAVSDIKITDIENSTKAGNLIIEMAKKIPNEGGWLAAIVGDNGLGDFGTKLVPFGQGLASYSEVVKGIEVSDIENSVKGGELIIEMAKKIPNEGGWLADIVGDNGIDQFGNKLKPFGEGMQHYANAVKGIDVSSIEVSEGAFDIILRIMQKIPKDILAISNAMDFNSRQNALDQSKGSNFIDKLIPIVDSMKLYGIKVLEIDQSAITNSEEVMNTMARIITNLQGINGEGIDSFVNAINMLGQANITQLVEQWNVSLIDFYNIGYEIINNMTLGIQSNQSTLLTIISTIITQMIQRLNLYKIQFYTMGILLFDLLGNGMKSRNQYVYNIVINLMNQIIESLRGYKNNYYQCGVFLGQGLIEGINSMRPLVYQAAFGLGQEAVRGMKEGLDSHSPSKETYQLGLFAGDGLILGMMNRTNAVSNTAKEMAKNVVDSVSTALQLANSIINDENNNDLVIRPVLDLSNVSNGAETISNLLNNSPSIGVNANLNSISRSMNSKAQNGTNNDIIASIDGLRKDIGKLQTNTYNIDGVTYDDGSNISEAINTLVDAIITERRT